MSKIPTIVQMSPWFTASPFRYVYVLQDGTPPPQRSNLSISAWLFVR